MKIVPLAAESLGVRSVATYVECGATRILIDPGAALAPSRFNLPPADAEWEALKRANDRISGYAARAGWVFVSHYHEEHFRHDPTLYRDRGVWAKDPSRMINPSQASRARELWKGLEGQCRMDAAEGRRYETADCVLHASPPLAHGAEGGGLGYVVALTVTDRREGFRFVHASDVQGPMSAVVAAYLVRERPDLLYLSGPPAYIEARIGSGLIERGVEHLLRVLDRTGCRVIMDHHALRDASYPERFRRLWDTGRVVTAAGFLGLADQPLEATRRKLWEAARKPARVMAPRLKPGRASGKMTRPHPSRRAKGGQSA